MEEAKDMDFKSCQLGSTPATSTPSFYFGHYSVPMLQDVPTLAILGGTLALRATFRLDSPVKHPHTDDPFQTPSKLGHPSYPNAPKFKSLKVP